MTPRRARSTWSGANVTAMDMTWPSADLAAMRSGGSYYRGAAICRRGDVETSYLDPSRERAAIAGNCPTCGANVLSACPNCNLRIRGEMHVPGVVGFSGTKRPSFCDGCGAAYPW